MSASEVLAALASSSGIAGLTVGNLVMIAVSLLVIYLGIARRFEPLLLVPIGFGGLLANVPFAEVAALSSLSIDSSTGEVVRHIGGFIGEIYGSGIETGLFPLLIFVGVGALTDFGPLLARPITALLGAAAQLGIFLTFLGAVAAAKLLGIDFSLADAGAIAIIGGADGPTAIFLASRLSPRLLGAIAVAAYSYMALVPIIQPPIMRLLTTKGERSIRMEQVQTVGKLERIGFPIVTTVLTALIIPTAIPLVGALMFGNLLAECGVTERLSQAASGPLMNITTLLLGLAVGSKLQADLFLRPETLLILALGLVAFAVGTASGVLLAKLMNALSRRPINPLIGAAGVSAVPMAARVVAKVAAEEEPDNYILMHAMGPNVAGVLGSALAAGVLLTLIPIFG